MRFKAKLAPEQLTALHQCVVSTAKIASSSSAAENSLSWMKNSGILALDRDTVRISCKSSVSCFAELKAQDGIFCEHRIESAAATVLRFPIDAVLEALNTGEYGILITDLHMPEVDGYMLAERIHEQFSSLDLPIIMLKSSDLGQMQIYLR